MMSLWHQQNAPNYDEEKRLSDGAQLSPRSGLIEENHYHDVNSGLISPHKKRNAFAPSSRERPKNRKVKAALFRIDIEMT
eukprot:jgi/Psemu1/301959/fgenesh1_kg.53_\